MDQEGWIEIALIAAFKRLASLTSDINLVREMMRLSCMTELRENKVRTVDWQNWILPMSKPVSWQDPSSSIEQGYQIPPMTQQYMQYGQLQGYGHNAMQNQLGSEGSVQPAGAEVSQNGQGREIPDSTTSTALSFEA